MKTLYQVYKETRIFRNVNDDNIVDRLESATIKKWSDSMGEGIEEEKLFEDYSEAEKYANELCERFLESEYCKKEKCIYSKVVLIEEVTEPDEDGLYDTVATHRFDVAPVTLTNEIVEDIISDIVWSIEDRRREYIDCIEDIEREVDSHIRAFYADYFEEVNAADWEIETITSEAIGRIEIDLLW